MRICRDIIVDHGRHVIALEGVDFPFHVGAEPEIGTDVDGIPLPHVTVTILADSVTVVGLVGSAPIRRIPYLTEENRAWVKATTHNIAEERLAETLAWLRRNGRTL